MLFESRAGSKGSDKEKLDRFFWEKGFELDFEDRFCQPLRGRDFREQALSGSENGGEGGAGSETARAHWGGSEAQAGPAGL